MKENQRLFIKKHRQPKPKSTWLSPTSAPSPMAT